MCAHCSLAENTQFTWDGLDALEMYGTLQNWLPGLKYSPELCAIFAKIFSAYLRWNTSCEMFCIDTNSYFATEFMPCCDKTHSHTHWIALYVLAPTIMESECVNCVLEVCVAPDKGVLRATKHPARKWCATTECVFLIFGPHGTMRKRFFAFPPPWPRPGCDNDALASESSGRGATFRLAGIN